MLHAYGEREDCHKKMHSLHRAENTLKICRIFSYITCNMESNGKRFTRDALFPQCFNTIAQRESDRAIEDRIEQPIVLGDLPTLPMPHSPLCDLSSRQRRVNSDSLSSHRVYGELWEKIPVTIFSCSLTMTAALYKWDHQLHNLHNFSLPTCLTRTLFMDAVLHA